MDSVPIDLKELMVRGLRDVTLLQLRRTSREWRRVVDGELHRRYQLPMRVYMSSMRMRCKLLPKRFLLRYAVSPPVSAAVVYKCSRCGNAYVGAFMSCDCKERERKERAHAKQNCVAVLILACVAGSVVRLEFTSVVS